MAAPDPVNILKILVATDNHLGYLEKDPIRGKDSFTAFEEILYYARKHKVDMVLLAGDMFHESRPSRNALYHATRILRKHVLRNDPVQFKIVSGKSSLHGPFAYPNYQDPNLNVGLPVFSIHGNHDDPGGFEGLAALDILSVGGMINYFGKITDFEDIKISPILFRKGTTKVAMYGMGHIRDERLNRAFVENKIQMLRPSEDPDSWYSIFALHQNRVAHGRKAWVAETLFDPFLDFMVWGHEHDCRIRPEGRGNNSQRICQPGSSVATSLSEGESVPKYCGILSVCENNWKMDYLRLRTVRPFVFKHISLQEDSGLPHTASEVEVSQYLEHAVEEARQQAMDEQPPLPDDFPESLKDARPTQPLVRVRVDYRGGYPSLNPQRFGQFFAGRIANAGQILRFSRAKPKPKGANDGVGAGVVDAEDVDALRPEPEAAIIMEDILQAELQRAGAKFSLFAPSNFLAAVEAYASTGKKDAIGDFMDNELKEATGDVMEKGDGQVVASIAAARKTSGSMDPTELLIHKVLAERIGLAPKLALRQGGSLLDEAGIVGVGEEDEVDRRTAGKARTVPTGRGKAAATRRGNAPATGVATVMELSDSSDDEQGTGLGGRGAEAVAERGEGPDLGKTRTTRKGRRSTPKSVKDGAIQGSLDGLHTIGSSTRQSVGTQRRRRLGRLRK